MKDQRFVYSAGCTFFGPIEKIGRNGGLPACPTCGSMLFEYHDAKVWWDGVDHHETRVPGYRKFIEWLEDKHFLHYTQAVIAYEQKTGTKINL